ncbi:hypothetical protein G6F19_014292 [Rhizopus arrhizus]|nr:hypothetical protein G6F19_014292 [Rhizopus arrhizus]
MQEELGGDRDQLLAPPAPGCALDRECLDVHRDKPYRTAGAKQPAILRSGVILRGLGVPIMETSPLLPKVNTY